jgi:hypothetical protein
MAYAGETADGEQFDPRPAPQGEAFSLNKRQTQPI